MDFGAPISVRRVKVRSIPKILTEEEARRMFAGGHAYSKRIWFIGSGLISEETTKPSKEDVLQDIVIEADELQITDIGHKT